MVSSFKLENKSNDDANFKGMHLYILSSYIIQQSMSMFCRECTRDLVQAMILDLVHSEEQAVEAPGSRFVFMTHAFSPDGNVTNSSIQCWRWAQPDVATYTTLIRGLAASLRVSDAIRMIKDISCVGNPLGDEVV